MESTLAECMAAGQVPRDDPHELAVALKALEEGYAFLIGGGADEAAKAEIGSALRKRALQLLGLRAPAPDALLGAGGPRRRRPTTISRPPRPRALS